MPDLMSKTESTDFQNWIIELSAEELKPIIEKDLISMESRECKIPRIGLKAFATIPSARCWKTELIKALFYKLL